VELQLVEDFHLALNNLKKKNGMCTLQLVVLKFYICVSNFNNKESVVFTENILALLLKEVLSL